MPCKAWEDQKLVGRYEQAIITCKDFGLSTKETIEYLEKSFMMSALEAKKTYREYATTNAKD